jgi:hypothetical protein
MAGTTRERIDDLAGRLTELRDAYYRGGDGTTGDGVGLADRIDASGTTEVRGQVGLPPYAQAKSGGRRRQPVREVIISVACPLALFLAG